MGGKKTGQNPKSSKTADSIEASAARKKAKKAQPVRKGIVHILASFNNTIIRITDQQGNSLGAQASAGSEGFKGSRKSTPFAAQVAAGAIGKAVKEIFSMEEIIVLIKGIGPGGNPAVKALKDYFSIIELRDVTGIPHNGPRKPKKRRV